MSDEALIDTNVVVKHLRRKLHPVTEKLAALDEAYIFRLRLLAPDR